MFERLWCLHFFLVVSRKKGEGEVIQKAVSGLIRLASDPPGHSARHMSHVTVLIPAWPTSHHIHITPTQHQQEFTNTGLVKHSANNTSYFPHIFCEFDSFVYSSQQVIDIIRTRPGGSTNNSNTRHKKINLHNTKNVGTFAKQELRFIRRSLCH